MLRRAVAVTHSAVAVALATTRQVPNGRRRVSAHRSASESTSSPDAFGSFRLVGLVLLPFVTGYFLSYYFRTVNAVLSTRLMGELSLSAAQLGVMTSAYFLMAALAQLPIGWALDRFGPRRVQICSLTLAAAGAALFARAEAVPALFGARALIGLGVASALLAGLKALAMISPPERLGLYNGIYVCIGALGAVTASLPTERILDIIHWRELFAILAAASLAAAVLIGLLVPKGLVGSAVAPATVKPIGFRDIIKDRYFWRLAPLSATAIGGAWALQGLWSAPWLRDTGAMTPHAIAGHLLIMALALSLGALGFGIILHRLATAGIPASQTMTFAALLYISAELALALAWPVPPLLSWCMVSAFAAATVLTYSMSAQHFPKESVGRANSAFNLLHFAAAFGVQCLFGAIIAQWPRDEFGHYPAEAYKFAFLCIAAVQLPALLWFLRPSREAPLPSVVGSLARVAAWGLVLLVGYHGFKPLLTPWTSNPTTSTTPASASASHDEPAKIENMVAHIRRIEARLQQQDRQIRALMSQVDRLQETERRGQHLLDEVGDSILYVSDEISRLSSEVDALERR